MVKLLSTVKISNKLVSFMLSIFVLLFLYLPEEKHVYSYCGNELALY